jgi:hypothetical protein
VIARYVDRALNSTLLAPQVVEAVVDGTSQTESSSLLKPPIAPPVDWTRQSEQAKASRS